MIEVIPKRTFLLRTEYDANGKRIETVAHRGERIAVTQQEAEKLARYFDPAPDGLKRKKK